LPLYITEGNASKTKLKQKKKIIFFFVTIDLKLCFKCIATANPKGAVDCLLRRQCMLCSVRKLAVKIVPIYDKKKNSFFQQLFFFVKKKKNQQQKYSLTTKGRQTTAIIDCFLSFAFKAKL